MNPKGINQYRTLKHERDLTLGAEQLLKLIERYQYTYNVTNEQYAKMMQIERQNVINYFNELIAKKYITVSPEHRKPGQGKACIYRAIDKYWPGKFDSVD